MLKSPVAIRGGPIIGDRLYTSLLAGEGISNALKLLCRDGTTVKVLHRDILQSASPFFRQLSTTNANHDKPILVGVSSRMLDLVIEFIYTTRINAVEIHELVELYGVADMLQLDELRNQLRNFFRDNMRECLHKEDFILHRSFEDVSRFMTIFPIQIDAYVQIRLIQAVYDWAKKNQIDGARVCDLIARIVTRESLSPSEPYAIGSALNSGSIRPHSVALLIGETQIMQIVHENFIDAELPACIVDRLVSSDSACISGNEVFIVRLSEVNTFDLRTGEQVRTLTLPFDWKLWCEKLVVRKGRAYTWYENDVYHLDGDNFTKICQTKENICDLAVIEHTSHSFKFAYEIKDKQTLVASNNGNSNELIEEAIPIQDIELVGVHEDAIIVCRSIDELMVYQNASVVWQHFLGGSVEFIFCAGNNVYIKRPNDLYIVDIVSHSIGTISPVPLGHFMVREILD